MTYNGGYATKTKPIRQNHIYLIYRKGFGLKWPIMADMLQKQNLSDKIIYIWYIEKDLALNDL